MKLYPDCGFFNDEKDDPSAPVECEYCYRFEICKKAYIEEFKKKYNIREVDGMFEISEELTLDPSKIVDIMKAVSEFSDITGIPVVTCNQTKIPDDLQFHYNLITNEKKRYASVEGGVNNDQIC